MTHEILLAGFGGQGILFAGKVLVYAGMLSGKQVSWLPSYGPEMRGGTANCHVIISDKKVGSPIITNPSVLVAMNKPSLDKFEEKVTKGGMIIVDSSLVDRLAVREDTSIFYLPATERCEKLANMMIVGKLIKETGIADMETLEKAIAKSVPPKKQDMIEANMRAIELGHSA